MQCVMPLLCCIVGYQWGGWAVAEVITAKD